jgi:hypothetical protein
VTSKQPISTIAVGRPVCVIPVFESIVPSVPFIYCCVPSTGSIHIPILDKSMKISFGIFSNDCLHSSGSVILKENETISANV